MLFFQNFKKCPSNFALTILFLCKKRHQKLIAHCFTRECFRDHKKVRNLSKNKLQMSQYRSDFTFVDFWNHYLGSWCCTTNHIFRWSKSMVLTISHLTTEPQILSKRVIFYCTHTKSPYWGDDLQERKYMQYVNSP